MRKINFLAIAILLLFSCNEEPIHDYQIWEGDILVKHQILKTTCINNYNSKLELKDTFQGTGKIICYTGWQYLGHSFFKELGFIIIEFENDYGNIAIEVEERGESLSIISFRCTDYNSGMPATLNIFFEQNEFILLTTKDILVYSIEDFTDFRIPIPMPDIVKREDLNRIYKKIKKFYNN